jgi:hypothetical protein
MVLKILEANAYCLFVFPKKVSVFNFILFLIEGGVAKAWTHAILCLPYKIKMFRI